MLLILNPKKEKEAKEIFSKWNLDYANIGKITASEKIVLKYKNEIVANIPLGSLTSYKSYKRNFFTFKKTYVKKTYKEEKISTIVKKY